MEQYWFIVAIFCSLLTGIFLYTNQVFKLSGPLFMVFRGVGQFLALLPFVMLFQPVHNIAFYILCATQGCLIAFNDYRLFRSSKAFGAEVTSSLQPLAIGLIFILWLVVNPADLKAMLNAPIHLVLVILCLLGITVSILKMKSAKTSSRAMKYLLPCLCLLSINDVINKEAMMSGAENLVSAIYFYCLITAFVSGGVNLYVYLKKHQFVELLKPQYRIKAVVIVFLVTMSMICKNYAMFLAPNPAYVSAIIFLYPLWIVLGNMLYRHFGGHIACASVRLSTVSVLLTSVIGLILLK
ncbi:MAG: hypothetical protein NC218_07750 [Acetobacter sp.]|nr:hypothetical protein [Acetobacter sp.]